MLTCVPPPPPFASVKRCRPLVRARPPALTSFAEQLLSKQDSLGRLIAVARGSRKKAVGRRVAGHGLTSQQFWVLVFLIEEAGPALCRVCDVLRMDAPTASRIVAALTRRRLVRATAAPADRRRARIKLTTEGRALARTLYPLAQEFRAAVEKDLS